jgi:hypothetical protein
MLQRVGLYDRLKFGTKWPVPGATTPSIYCATSARRRQTLLWRKLTRPSKDATAKWNAAQAEPWTIVRGQYILNEFTARCTDWSKGSSLVVAIAGQQPSLSALKDVEAAIDRLLA